MCVLLGVVTRKSSTRVVIGPVLPVLVKEIFAFVPKGVDASFEVDQQTALVGDDEILLRRRDQIVLVQRLRGKYIQVGQVREIRQIGQQIFLQNGTVDAVHRLHAQRGIEDPVAGGHHDVAAILVPNLAIALHVYSSLALAQVYLVATEKDHVLVPGRDVDAPTVAVVGRAYALAGAAVTIEQAVYVDAGDLAAAAGALEGRVRVVEHALEGVGDINAGTARAIERTGQVATLVRDALGLLRVFLIDTVARLVRRVRTVRQEDRRAVPA